MTTNKYDILSMQSKLKKNLDEYRYQHTLAVAYTAASMAMAYHFNVETALVAGLLHDCAKCMDKDKREHYCKKEGIHLTKYEIDNPSLQHAKIGAVLCETKYHVTDPAIKNAILYHTTGKSDMSLLEKIVFIADYIEPNRSPLPRIDIIRELAFNNIDLAMKYILEDSLEHLKRDGKTMDPMTKTAYDFYKLIN